MQRMWSTYLTTNMYGRAPVSRPPTSGRESVSRVRNWLMSTALTKRPLAPIFYVSLFHALPLDGPFVCITFYSVLISLQFSFRSSQSRPSSALSANSAHSAATSTRHMLSSMQGQLEPPSAPFASNASMRSSSPRTDSPLLGGDGSLSRSVNYLPTKFSDAVLYNGLKNRGKGNQLGPKRGGGREAFRSGESRMPGEGDDDYDGVPGGIFGKEGGRTRPRLRWNKFKWSLFFSNLLVSLSRSSPVGCYLL